MDASSQSGRETLTRLRLAALARRIDSQVESPQIARSGRAGFVDLLIDGWLVSEGEGNGDGDEFHEEGADRLCNAALVRHGYRWHRLGYNQIVGG
ncbi:MAG: hypothetical protein ACOH1J_07455 [Microbacteriaceae bacterium]